MARWRSLGSKAETILALSARTNPYDPVQRFVGGGLIGAGSGAAIGAAAAGGHGAALGAAVGGAVGAVAGLITTPPAGQCTLSARLPRSTAARSEAANTSRREGDWDTLYCQ